MSDPRQSAVTSGHPGGHDPRVVDELVRRLASDDRPRLDVAGTESLATWFLGPRAENAELLERLAKRAVEGPVADRKAYQPSDPPG